MPLQSLQTLGLTEILPTFSVLKVISMAYEMLPQTPVPQGFCDSEQMLAVFPNSPISPILGW